MSRGTVCGKIVYSKNFFFNFSDLRRENFGFLSLSKKRSLVNKIFFAAVMSKLHSEFPIGVFGEKDFIEKKTMFYSIKSRTVSEKKLKFCWKNNAGLVKATIYVSIGTLGGESVEKDFLNDLRTLKQDFLNTCRKNSTCLVKSAFQISRKSFWRKVFIKKKFFYLKKIQTLSKKSSTFCWKIFGGCKNSNQFVKWNNLRKNRWFCKK